MRKLNIVVVGRSGVGKSSFLNYAAGRNVFKTGIGEPVTQKYFEEIKLAKPQQNTTYCLFDTKGLEVGKTKEWENNIFKEIARRDKSKNIFDWFHTILFCIDASSLRIQPFEINAIKRLAEKSSVLVLLTKKDLVSPQKLNGLRAQIIRDVGSHVQVLSVCNVKKQTRKGFSKPEGLEKVLTDSFYGLWHKMSKILPHYAIKNLTFIQKDLFFPMNQSGLLAICTLFSFKINKKEKFEEQFPTFGHLLKNYLFIEDKDLNDTEIIDHFHKFDESNFFEVCQNLNLDYSLDKNSVIIHQNSYFKNLVYIPENLDFDELKDNYYMDAIAYI